MPKKLAKANQPKRRSREQVKAFNSDKALAGRLRKHRETKETPTFIHMTAKKLVTLEKSGRIYTDPRMQRRYVWLIGQQMKYIAGLNKNGSISNIVLAEVSACLAYCQGIQAWESVAYFQELKDKGFKYISIDGQQRTGSLVKFFDGEVLFDGMLFNSEKPESIEVSKMSWPDMLEMDWMSDESYRDSVEGRDIPVAIIRNATYEDLCESFENCQDGTSLNDQEVRNCKKTQIAEVVRLTAKANNALLTRVKGLKGPDFSRMEEEDFVAWFHTFEAVRFDDPINQGNITGYYDKGVADYDGNKESYLKSAMDTCALKLDITSNCFPFDKILGSNKPYMADKNLIQGFHLFLTVLFEDACDLVPAKRGDLWSRFEEEEKLRRALLRNDVNGDPDLWYKDCCANPHNKAKLKERFEKIKADFLRDKSKLLSDGLIVSLTKAKQAPMIVSGAECKPTVTA